MRKGCSIIVMTFKSYLNKQGGGGQGVPEELSLKPMNDDEQKRGFSWYLC